MARRDIAQYVLYYNNIRPHQYHQGLPPRVVALAITAGFVEHYKVKERLYDFILQCGEE